jgi:hypothetical protein
MGKEFELIQSQTTERAQYVLVYDWIDEELYYYLRRVDGERTHQCPAGKHKKQAVEGFAKFVQLMEVLP